MSTVSPRALRTFSSRLRLIVRAESLLRRRDFQQCRVELHEGCIHRAMLLMAGGAVRARRGLLSRLGGPTSKGKKSPPARKSPGVFGVDLNSHQVPRLKLAAVIDGAFSGRATRF